MKIFYKPKAQEITGVLDGSPWITRGLSGTAQIGVVGTATNSIGDGWCLHHLCGTLGSPLTGIYQANYDNTYHQLDREPVAKDTIYIFQKSSEFFIDSHAYNVESAQANSWGDPFNTEARITLTGFVPRQAKGGVFGDIYQELLMSPVLVVEDCEGNYYRVVKNDANIGVSVINPDYIILELKVSSDFKFLAIE